MRKGSSKMKLYRDGAKRFASMGRLLKDSRFVKRKANTVSQRKNK